MRARRTEMSSVQITLSKVTAKSSSHLKKHANITREKHFLPGETFCKGDKINQTPLRNKKYLCSVFIHVAQPLLAEEQNSPALVSGWWFAPLSSRFTRTGNSGHFRRQDKETLIQEKHRLAPSQKVLAQYNQLISSLCYEYEGLRISYTTKDDPLKR